MKEKEILERTETPQPGRDAKPTQLSFRSDHSEVIKKFSTATNQALTDVLNQSVELYANLAVAKDFHKSQSFLEISFLEEKLRLSPWTLWRLAQDVMARLGRERFDNEKSLLEALVEYIKEKDPNASIPGTLARITKNFLEEGKKKKKG